MTLNNIYRFVKSFSIPNRTIYDYYARNKQVTASVILQNNIYENLKVQDLLIKFKINKLKIVKVYRNNVLLFNNNNNNTFTFKLNDVIILEGIYKELFEIIPKLGVPTIYNALWNTLTIYKKNEK
jgi:hypothetical protein